MLQNRIGCIIPAYFAANSSFFTTIINEKNRKPNVPIAVILNISGTGAGTAAQAAYTTLMENLHNAGVTVLGYVNTDFASIPQTTVQAEIDKWFNFYNTGLSAAAFRVKGIYFGNMSNQTSNQTYYSNLHTYCRVTRGFHTTVGGAGNTVPNAFMNSTCADTIIVYEGAGKPPPSNYQGYDTLTNNNVGLIVFATASFDHEWTNQISAYAGWVYMTNDTGVNPYDTLPSYLPTMIDRLDIIGTGLSGGSSTDTFGIQKIYHTKTGGEEYYLNQSNPTADTSRFQNEPALTMNPDGSFSCQGSSPDYFVRLELWSPAYADTNQRIAAKWLNVEITGYIKMEAENASGTYLCQWYSRGGHHGSANPCEGSALKNRLYRRQRTSGAGFLGTSFVKEVCHSAYSPNHTIVNSNVPWTSTGFYNRWVGLKHVIYNVVESGSTFTKQETWIDPDVQDGSGNLVIQNNWVLVNSFVDRGNLNADQAAFDSDCSGCGRPRNAILTAPGGNTTSGHANFNRNLVAYRTDGIRARWKWLTAREIDPTKPAGTGAPPPAPAPTPEPASVFDAFGVRKVYATKTGANEWYLAGTPANDTRFRNNVTMTRNADNISWRVSNAPLIVFEVEQPNQYNAAVTESNGANHAQCAANGFMQDASDWRNVEVTGYVRVNAFGTGGGELVWYCRGGEHKDPQPYCPGSSMKASLLTDGRTRFAKEQYHIAYNYTADQNQLGISIATGDWFGFKYVCYNRLISGTLTVRQEIYVDIQNDNTWQKIDERVDSGGWGLNGTTCQGTTNDFLISWGGPLVGFRADNFTNIDFKWLSVREIDGDSVAAPPPPPQPPSSCGT